MKKGILLFLLTLSLFQTLRCQEWVREIDGLKDYFLEDLISVDGGESVLGIGRTTNIENMDGIVVKVDKDGESVCKVVHLPGMMLQYYSAVQLDNGNYMVFGVCDDSLCDPRFQRFLRVDVLNGQLETLSTRQYSVDDETFDYFYYAYLGQVMRSILSKSGSVLLASTPAHFHDYGRGAYRSVIRFYEFDSTGEIIRMVDYPPSECYIGSIKEITYAPHSDNLMVFVNGGWFGNAGGVSGIIVFDDSLQIVARQSLYNLGGAMEVIDNACEGRWLDDDHLIVDATKRIRLTTTYHMLYNVDSALNIHASLRLPPYDSCTWSPEGTSTAYINDTTIFAFTYCSEFMMSFDMAQANVILTDKHLNLLGRKVIRKDDVEYFCSSPATFNDGGCVIPMYSRNGEYYPGDPFFKVQFMKFRREDIEITWNVAQEQETSKASVYPNPAKGTVNIPIGGGVPEGARLQIFDMNGVKCFDCAITGQGNLITLDISSLGTGIYVYRIVSRNKEIKAEKFVIY